MVETSPQPVPLPAPEVIYAPGEGQIVEIPAPESIPIPQGVTTVAIACQALARL